MKNWHPNNEGFYSLNIPSKEVHKIFLNRRLSFYISFSLWYNPKGCKYMIVENHNWKMLVITTLLLPILCILSITEIKRIFEEYFDLFNSLEKGNYMSDTIYPKYKWQTDWNSSYWGKCYKLHKEFK